MRKMPVVGIVVMCALGFAFACGEDGDDGEYTESKYIEKSETVYCERFYECDPSEFAKEDYSSIDDCIEARKEYWDCAGPELSSIFLGINLPPLQG